jgi:hypothetical protein
MQNSNVKKLKIIKIKHAEAEFPTEKGKGQVTFVYPIMLLVMVNLQIGTMVHGPASLLFPSKSSLTADLFPIYKELVGIFLTYR